MATNHAHPTELKNPGTFSTPGGLKMILIVFTIIGIAAFAGGLSHDPTRAWSSLLLNHFFFMSLALGGVFFAAINWLTSAMWSAPLRRVSESFTAYLPFALLTFVALYFGLHKLYPWSDPSAVAADAMLRAKVSYLNAGFFMVRNILGLGVLIFLTYKMVRNSVLQDTTRDPALSARNRSLSPAFLIIFGLLFSMAAFDQLMSLDSHWYSTMFGVYIFAGLFYANLASTCLLTIYLLRKGKLTGIVNDNHLHDMGKYMFAFTVFWAYIGFSQFMLIWYANIPEETLFFIDRMKGGWVYVSIFLIAGKFAIPFFLLLPRDAKRNTKLLSGVAIFMLVSQWIDLMWIIQPNFSHDGPQLGWIEIGTTLGFLGIFGLFVSRFLSRHNVVAVGDPKLPESILHHHQ